jgi:hypothetical protein
MLIVKQVFVRSAYIGGGEEQMNILDISPYTIIHRTTKHEELIK